MTTRVTVLLKSSHALLPTKVATSFELYYPRSFLHEEFLTHRALSRNAASSRATPAQKMMEQVRLDPAIPSRWGTNGTGMQDHGEMTPEEAAKAKAVWMGARDDALKRAGQMMKLNPAPHKQITNIILRPYEHITTVVTATEWANFFKLRRSPDAKPEFKELADMMWEAYKAAPMQTLQPGQWHLPYIYEHEQQARSLLPEEKREEATANLIKVSAARCARTSYKNHRNKVSTFAEDVELYERLASAGHFSPMEHQATPDTFRAVFDTKAKKMTCVWDHADKHGNLNAFIQHRKTLPGENVTTYDPEA